MLKRSSFNIKKKILELIKSSPLTYAQLERKINTGYRTIKSNCEELECFGLIKIKKNLKHSANGKPFFNIEITEKGREFLKK